MTRARTSAIAPYLYLLPGVLILAVFFVGAFVQVGYYSLGTYNPFDGTFRFDGLDNYRLLFADRRFWLCLVNSFAYLLITPAIVTLSLACAMIVHSGVRGSGGFRLVYFLPVVTPTIVAAVAWRILYNEDSGLLNRTLESLGFEGVGWLTQRPFTLISAMIVTLWKGFGFYMMIFLAALLGVPRELEEAAALDGAGRLRSFFTVTLPSIWPVAALVLVMSSIAALKVFDEMFVTVRGAPIDQQTAVPFVYETAFVEGSFGVASAAGVALFVVILLFSLINLRVTGAAR